MYLSLFIGKGLSNQIALYSSYTCIRIYILFRWNYIASGKYLYVNDELCHFIIILNICITSNLNKSYFGRLSFIKYDTIQFGWHFGVSLSIWFFIIVMVDGASNWTLDHSGITQKQFIKYLIGVRMAMAYQLHFHYLSYIHTYVHIYRWCYCFSIYLYYQISV